MRFLTTMILGLVLSLPAGAQTPAQGTNDEMLRLLRVIAGEGKEKTTDTIDPYMPVRVYPVRYIDVRHLVNLLASFGQNLKSEPNLNAISVRGPVAMLDAVGEIVKQYDVPGNASKDVDITVYLLLASSQAGSGPDAEAAPAVLRPVIDQLRAIMAYKSYRVLDTIITRGTEGGTLQTQGVISRLADSDPEGQPAYNFRARARVTGEGAGQVVHFDEFNFTVNLRLPNVGNQNLTIGTAVDVKKGQQVVVGKATVLDRALILVMSVKVVE